MNTRRRTTPWILTVVACFVAAGCGDQAQSPDPPDVRASPSAAPTPDAEPSEGFLAGGGLTSPAPPSVRADPSESTEVPEPPDITDVNRPPRTYAEALDRFTAAFALYDIPYEFSRFQTPTGNIYCVLDDPGIPAGCEIGTGGVRDDAECIESPSPIVGRIEFTERGFVPVCNSDTIRTPGPPVLGYTGVASVTGLPFQCLSEEIGVTCISTAQEQGFFIARGRYQIF